MPLDVGSRLGIAGLIVALFAIAAFYLWPEKKWIGKLSLVLAGGLVFGWFGLEIKQRWYQQHPRQPTATETKGGNDSKNSRGSIPAISARLPAMGGKEKAAQASTPCGPIPASSGGPSGFPGADSATVIVTRSSAASGADVRDFKTTGRGNYELDMHVPNMRPEELEFRFAANKAITVERNKAPQSLRDSGHPLTIERFTDRGFRISDSGCAGIPFSVIWMRGSEIGRFAILYNSKPLDGQDITLKRDIDPTKPQIAMLIEPAFPSVFSIWGVSARNEGSSALEPDTAYLSFSSSISKSQRNDGCWEPSPDRNVEGWSTFRCRFAHYVVSPEHAIDFEVFRGTPIPTTAMKCKAAIVYGTKEAIAEFTLRPPG